MHRIAIAFIPFILAASTASVPVFAVDHRDTRITGICHSDGCMGSSPSTVRSEQIGFAKITGGDPLGMGEAIDFKFNRVDSPCTAPGWSAWPVADKSALKFDHASRRENRPGADLQGFVADAGTPRGFPDGPVAGVRKLENVPIVRDNSGEAKYHQARRDPDGGVDADRQDTRLSLLQNARTVPGSKLTRSDSLQEQWLRLPDTAIPEPGTWAVLIAGLLGICAVARPRIFSS